MYHELDQELQEAFVSFLEERGVHAELGRHLQVGAVALVRSNLCFFSGGGLGVLVGIVRG